MNPSRAKNVICLLTDSRKIWKGSLIACIVKDDIKKVGYPRDDGRNMGGIQCLCCNMIFSMSNFELHAGSKHKRGSNFVFLLDGSGKSLAMLKTELEGQSSTASTCSITPQQSRKTCNLCFANGELTCCCTAGCPAAFHIGCSTSQILPGWYCQKCSCRRCHAPLRTSNPTTELNLVLCEQCGDEYHLECLLARGNFCYNTDFEWFCSNYCEKTFEVLRELILLTLPPSNPQPIVFVRWSGERDNMIFYNGSASTLCKLETRKAAEASKLFSALKLLEQNFKEENHSRGQPDLLHNMLYPDPKGVSRSTHRALDHTGFYTVLIEGGDPLISRVITVVTIRLHSKRVAEIPFIATSESDRGMGFSTQLMNGLLEVLKMLEVQHLVVQSPPEFLGMWASKYSLLPVNSETQRSLLDCNLMKLEGRTLLYKDISSRK